MTDARHTLSGNADRQTVVDGFRVVPLKRHDDSRGGFLKIYQSEIYAELGIDQRWQEAFFSWSHPGVARGMHFQIPPYEQAKIVVCLSGRILDVVVDLRIGSPSEGVTSEMALDGNDPLAMYVPTGCAHGFAVLGNEPALLAYLVSSVHHPVADAGILWSSVPASWPSSDPVVSDRDRTFPSLGDFRSPFLMPS